MKTTSRLTAEVVCVCAPRCVSCSLALAFTALCLPTAPIRRPSLRSSTSSPFRHSFPSSESMEAPQWLWLTRYVSANSKKINKKKGTFFPFFGVRVTVFVFWRLRSCNPSSQPPLNVSIIGNASQPTLLSDVFWHSCNLGRPFHGYARNLESLPTQNAIRNLMESSKGRD